MSYRSTSRSWVKLWVNEWLDGTTRYQMTDAQRAFWVDLLAMAGRSRHPGIVAAGQDGEKWVGYPLSFYQAKATSIEVLGTLQLFVNTNKILLEETEGVASESLFKVTILNWDKYQSEYMRQKAYRPASAHKVTRKVTTKNTKRLPVEGEKRERRKRISSKPFGSDVSIASSSNGKPDTKAVILRLWSYYLEKLDKNPKLLTLTPLRENKAQKRLAECIRKTGGDLVKAEELMQMAIGALAESEFHRGANDNKKHYDSWERNLFPSLEKFEWWLERAGE